MSPGPAVTAMPSIASRPADGVGQRLLDHRNDRFQVLAGGQLRNHAAVGAVDRDLGGHDAGEQPRGAVVDGGGGLVAGALDAEDAHRYLISSALPMTGSGFISPREAFRIPMTSTARRSPTGRSGTTRRRDATGDVHRDRHDEQHQLLVRVEPAKGLSFRR